MWGAFLSEPLRIVALVGRSEPLRIVALVGRYPANWLMRRMAIRHLRGFPAGAMQPQRRMRC